MLGTGHETPYFAPAAVLADPVALALTLCAIFRGSCKVGSVFAAHALASGSLPPLASFWNSATAL